MKTKTIRALDDDFYRGMVGEAPFQIATILNSVAIILIIPLEYAITCRISALHELSSMSNHLS